MFLKGCYNNWQHQDHNFFYEETMIFLMQSLPLSYSTLVNSLKRRANLQHYNYL
jgi:hypothetical protein